MHIMISILLGLAPAPDASVEVTSPTLQEALTHAVERRKRIPSAEKVGKIRHWKVCRTSPGGCEVHIGAMIGYMLAVAELEDVDPHILAAMAWVESRYSPFATGAAGEMGLMQILPSNRHGLAFMGKGRTGERYRAACREEVGQCQAEVVVHAATMLAERTAKCGSLEAGLSAYNTGKCGSTAGAKYAARVMRMASDLRMETDAAMASASNATE